MARIVGVHGIAQQYKGGFELQSTWFDALRDGLTAAGFAPQAAALHEGDLEVAFFGDLFRPQGTMGTEPRFTPSDLEPGFEQQMLAQFYDEAVQQQPAIGPTDGEMGVAYGVQQMLRRLAKSKALAGIVENLFVRDLKQVNWFLDDSDTKDEVLRRVDAKVSDETRIAIGHSLGSVVIYEYLCKYQPASVELLVTVGSPLGIRNLVFDRLTPRPQDVIGAWPGLVKRWVNVADPGDVVPLVKELAPLFPGPDGTAVVDRAVNNGPEPHMINRYLNSKQAGEAVGSAL